MIQDSLVQLGFRDKEVPIFLALVQSGPQPVSVVTKKTRLNRSTVYGVLESLVGRGFVSRVLKDNVQYYCAVSGNKLLELLKVRKSELERQERNLTSALPQLMGMMNLYLEKPKVSYFEGAQGVMIAMEETLKSNDTLLCYCPLDAWLESSLADYIRDYIHRRTQVLKIPNRVLECDTPLARKFFYEESPPEFTEHRFIPSGVAFSHSEVNIFDNKVAIVSLLPANMFGVILESKEIADTQRAIFELAWRGCA